MTTYTLTLQRHKRRLISLTLLLSFLSLLLLCVGRYPKVGLSSPALLFSDPLFANIVLNIRLPRLLLSLFGGASLAVAGFVFQMLFANPLVEPGFLGVSQGAAFGSATMIVVFGFSPLFVQLGATVCGLLALALSYTIARKLQFGGWILRLVLSGIAVGAFFSALLSIVKLVANPTANLQDITFWLMGGLYNSSWQNSVTVLPIMGVSLILLSLLRWRVNILSLDDRTAHSIGLAVTKEKSLLLFIATVATTATISVSGLVGWIGLIVPHLSRRYFGSDARFALPGSIVLGALFLLLCDSGARTLFSSEIPLGVITSLLGALLFVVILSRKQSGVHL